MNIEIARDSAGAPALPSSGIDTAGAGATKPAGVNDQFLFTMASGQNITGNNFGERGYTPVAITKGLLLASRNP